ncbi:hypothetical protein [Winogradskyella sediminis]|uniref:Uncharacterized protein n=1 Tax=Winogradskyella sediminis TaxID=1382466 RepID=A0A1H1U3Q7_9FLAO|nr:hypothetical protein [Winogradskyella sediminis]SDS66529.1 hypothetical protein SAMN04489797_2109 [Winogradskyella sediminis]
MRLLYFVVFLFVSSLVYGQKSVLLQNTNTRAKELKHYLNKTEDSIVFKCDRTIYELMIFNDEDFERVIKVKDTVAKIQISDIPVGRYAVEAVLKDKLIIITLLRNQSFDLKTPTLITSNNHNNHTTQIDSLSKSIPFGSESNTIESDLRLSGKKANQKETKGTTSTNRNLENRISIYKSRGVKTTKISPPRLQLTDSKRYKSHSNYWVIYKINKGSSSEKILRIVDQKTVDKMIRKIETDMKTSTGRLNELTAWEIYDTTHFVQHKRKNRSNYMNIESNSFNIVPYYKIEHER